MTLSPPIRRVVLIIALVILLSLAWIGIRGGLQQLPQTGTPGQRVQTLTQVVYGLSALLSVVTVFWGRRWSRAVQGVWLISVTLAGGLAPVVWGGSSALIGLVSGVASLLVALGILWLLRVGSAA